MVNKAFYAEDMMNDTCWQDCSIYCISLFWFLQVQDIEFAQIEMKVIEGLKVGNDCLKKMHEVCNEKWVILHHV